MAERQRKSPEPSTPLCPTTPGGIPIRLLVDSEPRSRARRALPVVLLVALAAGIAAVALAGCGAPAVPRSPGAVVNRAARRVSWLDDVTAREMPGERGEAGPAGAALRVPPFALHVAAPVEPAE